MILILRTLLSTTYTTTAAEETCHGAAVSVIFILRTSLYTTGTTAAERGDLPRGGSLDDPLALQARSILRHRGFFRMMRVLCCGVGKVLRKDLGDFRCTCCLLLHWLRAAADQNIELFK